MKEPCSPFIGCGAFFKSNKVKNQVSKFSVLWKKLCSLLLVDCFQSMISFGLHDMLKHDNIHRTSWNQASAYVSVFINFSLQNYEVLFFFLEFTTHLEILQRSSVRPSERLASLGIMEDTWRASLKSPSNIMTGMFEGFKGVLNKVPIGNRDVMPFLRNPLNLCNDLHGS